MLITKQNKYQRSIADPTSLQNLNRFISLTLTIIKLVKLLPNEYSKKKTYLPMCNFIGSQENIGLHSFCLMMKHQKMPYLVCRWTWADFQFAVNLGAVIAAGCVAHDARALGQVEHAREQSGG